MKAGQLRKRDKGGLTHGAERAGQRGTAPNIQHTAEQLLVQFPPVQRNQTHEDKTWGFLWLLHTVSLVFSRLTHVIYPSRPDDSSKVTAFNSGFCPFPNIVTRSQTLHPSLLRTTCPAGGLWGRSQLSLGGDAARWSQSWHTQMYFRTTLELVFQLSLRRGFDFTSGGWLFFF